MLALPDHFVGCGIAPMLVWAQVGVFDGYYLIKAVME
jgi:hypothetical protein